MAKLIIEGDETKLKKFEKEFSLRFKKMKLEAKIEKSTPVISEKKKTNKQN